MTNRFLIGCYYPEHWGDAEMREDPERIKSLGFNVVRMGEFGRAVRRSGRQIRYHRSADRSQA